MRHVSIPRHSTSSESLGHERKWVAPEAEARLVESLPSLFDRADAVAEDEEDEGDDQDGA